MAYWRTTAAFLSLGIIAAAACDDSGDSDRREVEAAAQSATEAATEAGAAANAAADAAAAANQAALTSQAAAGSAAAAEASAAAAEASAATAVTSASAAEASAVAVADRCLGLLPLNTADFGAVGDGSTDDSSALQQAIDAARDSVGMVFVPSGTYRIDAALQLINLPNGFRFDMGPGALIRSYVAGPALVVRNVRYGRFHVAVEVMVADGHGLLVEARPPAYSGEPMGQTMRNLFSGQLSVSSTIRNHSNEVAKPEQGDGSMGIHFRLQRETDDTITYANYFNTVKEVTITRFDTGIYLGHDSNAQSIRDFLIQKYWYAILIHSDENRIVDGFCHQAWGAVDLGRTECVHLGAPSGLNPKTHVSFNSLVAVVSEPGELGRTLRIQGGSLRNFVQIGDNTMEPNILESSNQFVGSKDTHFLNLTDAPFP